MAAVRELIGPDVPLQVDANTAYRRDDIDHLCRLDEFDLLLIEQPLPEDDLIGHVRLANAASTPICLDESITSVTVASDAIELGACEIVNLKPGRVGGYLEARRIHDLCVELGVPVWCGGMLETGIGRAANAALAALDGFTLTGDISASSRFWTRDIVRHPIEVVDGHVAVPDGPGFGVEIDHEFLDSVTVDRDERAARAVSLSSHAAPVPVRRVDGRGQGHPRTPRRRDRQGQWFVPDQPDRHRRPVRRRHGRELPRHLVGVRRDGARQPRGRPTPP